MRVPVFHTVYENDPVFVSPSTVTLLMVVPVDTMLQVRSIGDPFGGVPLEIVKVPVGL